MWPVQISCLASLDVVSSKIDSLLDAVIQEKDTTVYK